MSSKSPNPHPPRMPGRYLWGRRLHCAGSLYLALLGGSRAFLAWRDRALLSELGVRPGPGYLAGGGLLWLLLGLAAAGLLFVARPWARWAVFACGLACALTYWADRLFLARSPQSNWPFALFLTLILLGFSASLAHLLNQWEVQHGRQR